jgi:hypothetical protein
LAGFYVLGGSDGRGCEEAAFPSPKENKMNEMNEEMKKKLYLQPKRHQRLLGCFFRVPRHTICCCPSCGFPSLPAAIGVSSLVVVVVLINIVVSLDVYVVGRLVENVEMVVVKEGNIV